MYLPELYDPKRKPLGRHPAPGDSEEDNPQRFFRALVIVCVIGMGGWALLFLAGRWLLGLVL